MLFKSAKIFSNQTPMNEVSTIQTKAPESVASARSLSERAHLPGVDAYCSGSDGLWGGDCAPSYLIPAQIPWTGQLEIRFTLAWLPTDGMASTLHYFSICRAIDEDTYEPLRWWVLLQPLCGADRVGGSVPAIHNPVSLMPSVLSE